MSVVRRSRLRISVYCQDYVWDHDYAIAFAVPICESGRLDTKTEQPMDQFAGTKKHLTLGGSFSKGTGHGCHLNHPNISKLTLYISHFCHV